MIKKLVALSLSAIILSTTTACSFDSNSIKNIVSELNDTQKPYPVQIGHDVVQEKPKSVVVLDDNVADILIACGYKDKIVGRTSDCTQKDIEKVEVMGSDHNPKIEAVNNVKADVIFASTEIKYRDYSTLKENNKTVLRVSSAKNEESLKSLYVNLCRVMEGNIQGETVGSSKATAVISAVNKYEKQPIIAKGCYLFKLDDNSAITNDMYSNTILKYAGIQNIATENNKNGNMPIAQILSADKQAGFPFYIICEKGLKAKILSDNRFATSNVVNKNRIIEIPSSLITRQGVSATQGIKYITDTITKQNKATGESLAEDYGIEITESLSYTIGEEDSNVMAIQLRLDDLGYLPINPTGYFGESTAQAVKEFQTNNELNRRDGVADNETLKRLFSTVAFSRATPVKSANTAPVETETATEENAIITTF